MKTAIENGGVNENGVSMITVIADGAWSKRSYRTNYNALSGVVSMNIFKWCIISKYSNIEINKKNNSIQIKMYYQKCMV